MIYRPWSAMSGDEKKTYIKWKSAYYAAEQLRSYMYERWRNEYELYQAMSVPVLDKWFGITLENV
jgi:hypothetical protein